MAAWWRSFVGGGGDGPRLNDGTQMTVPGTSGLVPVVVDFDRAMGVSAFWAACRLLAETVAAMPLLCYEIGPAGNMRKVTSYQLWRVLNFQPNRYQTRTEFLECLMLNLVSTGNAYFAIQRDPAGRVVGLLPLMSAQMQVELVNGDAVYTYYAADGSIRVYAAESIWHIKLFGNGVMGLSPLGYARQSLGIAIATNDRASQLAASGGKTNGILMVDSVLKPEQRAAIRKNFEGLTEGRTDQLFVLEANMKFERTSLSPQDMELLDTRKFQIEDIARFMGVPSVLINDNGGTTVWGSGVQQIVEGFYKLNLRPYLERIEASLLRHLMPVGDWERYSIQFDFDALLRADMLARMDGYNKAINAGVLTPNEARQDEGREPMPGGDAIYLNGSLVPAGTSKVQGQKV